MQLWHRAKNYIGEDYSDYYLFFVRCRDSNACDESNFIAALNRLGGESETVKVVRFSSWLCGWIEMLLIHKDDLKSVKLAELIERDLDDYPILDEDEYDRLCEEYGEDD